MGFNYSDILNYVSRKEVYDMIVIEGVVGVGKSSLMRILGKEGYEEFEEPVVDNPVLDKFYHDRCRYSFPLQVFFLNKRFEHIKQAKDVSKAVMDRSIYGDAIFARMLNLSGEMSDEEFQIYSELLQNMLEHVHVPKLMVYLEISVDEAMNRIKKRGRDYELIVEREYWEKLNDEYSNYFDNYDLSPMLKINVDNLDFENNEADRIYVLKLINEALLELK
ncbi:deoxynucleoside kinase [Erysipelothrix amsterdamensis]|uniref:Deoxynucleoside kinase n=2 Tax=Erysipelothrix amsterdamensis TaxID=2929157 RepID=A0AAU9VG09_9FIRM|nr:deoxynucleoside kinase [Erysipelothrix sp. A18Y020d]CAH2761530.1 deoxynucleoside kinase [Erysipelothrix sp. A18Y020d]